MTTKLSDLEVIVRYEEMGDHLDNKPMSHRPAEVSDLVEAGVSTMAAFARK